MRVVGTGGSLAGNEGRTVRCDVAVDDVVAGLGTADVALAGFAAEVVVVVDVATALGAGVAYAARMQDEEKLRCDVRNANGDSLEAETVNRVATPLRAGATAILLVSGWGFDIISDTERR